MTFNIGDVVMLKSGGQALTVASVEGDEVTCLWIGEEGDLFREKLPVACLCALDLEDDEDETEDDEENEDDSDEEDEDRLRA